MPAFTQEKKDKWMALVMAFIRKHHIEFDRPPTYECIGKQFGWAPDRAQRWVNFLVEAGQLEFVPGKAWYRFKRETASV